MGGLFYQSEANQLVDYQLWRLDGSNEFFRGPQMVLRPQKFVAYLGAAQTFGTFCRYPFPNLIAERIGLATANLGVGGAGAGRQLRAPCGTHEPLRRCEGGRAGAGGHRHLRHGPDHVPPGRPVCAEHPEGMRGRRDPRTRAKPPAPIR